MRWSPQAAICLLDRDDELMDDLEQHITKSVRNVVVQKYNQTLRARKALEARRRPRAAKPVILISDMFSAEPPGSSFFDYVRDCCPGIKILLHSRRATNEFASDLLDRKIIDCFIRKPGIDSLKNTVAEWVNQLGMNPVLRNIWSYVQRCDDPDAKFFPDGKGDYLSIVDLYWEAVWGTEIGHEATIAWDQISRPMEARSEQ